MEGMLLSSEISPSVNTELHAGKTCNVLGIPLPISMSLRILYAKQLVDSCLDLTRTMSR